MPHTGIWLLMISGKANPDGLRGPFLPVRPVVCEIAASAALQLSMTYHCLLLLAPCAQQYTHPFPFRLCLMITGLYSLRSLILCTKAGIIMPITSRSKRIRPPCNVLYPVDIKGLSDPNQSSKLPWTSARTQTLGNQGQQYQTANPHSSSKQIQLHNVSF